MAEPLVVDASAIVDLLVGSPLAASIETRLRGHELHVPAHFDAEVLSALGCLQRSGSMTVRQVIARIQRLASAPFQRHLLAALLTGAWQRRNDLRLGDALYVELADRLSTVIVTTDASLAAASPAADLLSANP